MQLKEIIIGVSLALVVAVSFLIWQGYRYTRDYSMAFDHYQNGDIEKMLSAADFSALDEAPGVFPLPEHTRYEMELKFDPLERKLYATSSIYTRNTTGADLTSLPLSCYPNLFRDASVSPVPAGAYPQGFDPGWLNITGAWMDGQPAAVIGNGETTNWIQWTEPLVRDAEFCLVLDWEVMVPRAQYRFGAMESIFVLGGVYPSLVPYDGYEWHTPFNSKFGDPFCLQAADYSVSVTVPQGYVIVANGVTAGSYIDKGKQTYVYSANRVRDFSLVVISHYIKSSMQSGNIFVHTYYPFGTSQPDLKRIASILAYYSHRFSPYPMSDFNVVYVPMQGFDGMEYSGLILLREDYLTQKLDNADFIIAHEIAHQWWYGIVGNDQSREPWLDEGLANWSAYQYLKQAGLTGAVKPATSPIKLNRGLNQFSSRQEYYEIAYTRGSGFWFALEQQIGSENVWAALRLYAAAYEGKLASAADLLGCIRQVTDRSLDTFFSAWIK